MAKRNQAEEITRAADRITDAVQELTSTLNRFLDLQEHSRRRFEEHQRQGEVPWSSESVVEHKHPRRELPEEEAVDLALAATHAAREEMGRGLDREEKLPAPSPEEVRKRREERRMREAEGYY